MCSVAMTKPYMVRRDSNIRWMLAAGLALSLPAWAGCKCSAPKQEPEASPQTERPAASVVAAAAAKRPIPLIPSGPMMAIVPGKGIGPIRFGATFKTVVRLMEKECTERSETICAYPDRGVVLGFSAGVVSTIDVYRGGRLRPDAKAQGAVFGIFNGAIPPDIMLGMVPEAVQEGLGVPERVEKLDEPSTTLTVERHYYDGAILDYDLNPLNKKLMLGRIRLIPSRGAHKASPAPAP